MVFLKCKVNEENCVRYIVLISELPLPDLFSGSVPGPYLLTRVFSLDYTARLAFVRAARNRKYITVVGISQ